MVFCFYYSASVNMKRIEVTEKTKSYCCFLSEITKLFVLYESDGITFSSYNNAVFLFDV